MMTGTDKKADPARIEELALNRETIQILTNREESEEVGSPNQYHSFPHRCSHPRGCY
jgi:hypothetical protein